MITKIRFVSILAAMGLLFCAAGASAQLSLDDAVAQWQMGTSADLNGGESPLTLFGDFHVGVDFNSAGYVLDQIDAWNNDGLAAQEGPLQGFGWVSVGPGDELFNTGPMTVFSRIRFEAFDGIDDIIRLSIGVADDNFALELDNGKPRFGVYSGGAFHAVDHGSTLSTGTWYDVTGVYDAALSSITLHVFDPNTGLEVGSALSANASSAMAPGGDMLFFEAFLSANGLNHGAQMELAAIWDVALTPNEVAELSAIPPIPAMASPTSDPTFDLWIPVTVTFTEPVAGFTAADLVVSNAQVLNFNGSSAVYNFNLVPLSEGLVTVDIPAGVANAIAGSGLPNRAAEQFRRTYAGPPGPTVDMLSPAPDPTNFSPIPVIATFSEPVTGFTASDLVVFNATVANFAVNPSSAAIYTFDLFPIQNGLVTADIPQGVALNALWRPNMAAPQFSRTFLDTRPAVTISSTTPDPTAETPFPLSVWFSEPVSGFDALDMNVSNASVFHASGFDGDQLYTFWITPQLPGLVTIDIPPGVAVGDAPPSGRVNTAAARFERTFTIVLRPKARVGREWMLYR